jgi:enoyl-CoA hydratase/carnithine racemase
VQGVATAAGCQLAASCDIVLAAKSASFCTPGVDIGLFCSTPMVALTRSIGAKHALEMLLTGDRIGAEDALRFGLVNRVVEDNRLSEEVQRLARKLAAKPQKVVALGKRLFHAQGRMALDHAYALASKTMVENLLMAEADEGICAFLEKRRPRWNGA